MNTRKIGGLDVTVIGVGCNNFGRRVDDAGAVAVVHAALEVGINFFDTADIYGNTRSEELLGEALKGRRGEAIIATKFGHAIDDERKGAHPDYIRRAVEDSLRRLGTDYIDLYQLHVPDATVPIADTLGALNDLVDAGKVREIGASNFTLDQLREAEAAVRTGEARFVSLQNHYSLFHQSDEERAVLDECARTGVGYLPYFPLANGLLTGKYRKGQQMPEGTRLSGTPRGEEILTTENLDKVENLITYAEARGRSILELAFGWLLAHPAISSVIAGASSPAQIHANAAASNWQMTDAEVAEINAIVA